MGYQDRPYFNQSPWGERQPLRFSEYSMVTKLILVTVAIWLIDLFTATSKGGNWFGDYFSLHADWWRRPWELFQLLTYGFIHAPIQSKVGVSHILFNMLTLFFLGRRLEERYGRKEFLRIYLLAIFFSGLVWWLVHLAGPGNATLRGASGGVSAVLALFILNYPREKLLLMGAIPTPAWLIGVIALLSDIGNSISSQSTIAGEAHLAGAAFAALYFYRGWNLDWLDWTGWFQRRSKLRVHRPQDDYQALQEQVDLILEKISREGEASLTRRERKKLEQLSKKIRERKQQPW
jgi:membrane associated rhomboid family serine protease